MVSLSRSPGSPASKTTVAPGGISGRDSAPATGERKIPESKTQPSNQATSDRRGLKPVKSLEAGFTSRRLAGGRSRRIPAFGENPVKLGKCGLPAIEGDPGPPNLPLHPDLRHPGCTSQNPLNSSSAMIAGHARNLNLKRFEPRIISCAFTVMHRTPCPRLPWHKTTPSPIQTSPTSRNRSGEHLACRGGWHLATRPSPPTTQHRREGTPSINL